MPEPSPIEVRGFPKKRGRAHGESDRSERSSQAQTNWERLGYKGLDETGNPPPLDFARLRWAIAWREARSLRSGRLGIDNFPVNHVPTLQLARQCVFDRQRAFDKALRRLLELDDLAFERAIRIARKGRRLPGAA